MELKTPLYNLANFPSVYDPSEDSFLFLDALEKESEFLRKLQPKIAVEIGSGSGIVISGLSSLLKDSCTYFATDINPEACLATLHTAKLNNKCINCLNMNLLDNFKNELFDLILFNPPYVVTDTSEIEGTGLSRAWAGGENGREIIDKVLFNLRNLLNTNGACYMVLIKENNIDDIKNIMSKFNFITNIIIERKIRGEYLYVVKFSKK